MNISISFLIACVCFASAKYIARNQGYGNTLSRFKRSALDDPSIIEHSSNIERLNSKTMLLSYSSISIFSISPWALQAKNELEEQKELLLAVAKLLSTIVPDQQQNTSESNNANNENVTNGESVIETSTHPSENNSGTTIASEVSTDENSPNETTNTKLSSSRTSEDNITPNITPVLSNVGEVTQVSVPNEPNDTNIVTENDVRESMTTEKDDNLGSTLESRDPTKLPLTSNGNLGENDSDPNSLRSEVTTIASEVSTDESSPNETTNTKLSSSDWTSDDNITPNITPVFSNVGEVTEVSVPNEPNDTNIVTENVVRESMTTEKGDNLGSTLESSDPTKLPPTSNGNLGENDSDPNSLRSDPENISTNSRSNVVNDVTKDNITPNITPVLSNLGEVTEVSVPNEPNDTNIVTENDVWENMTTEKGDNLGSTLESSDPTKLPPTSNGNLGENDSDPNSLRSDPENISTISPSNVVNDVTENNMIGTSQSNNLSDVEDITETTTQNNKEIVTISSPDIVNNVNESNSTNDEQNVVTNIPDVSTTEPTTDENSKSLGNNSEIAVTETVISESSTDSDIITETAVSEKIGQNTTIEKVNRDVTSIPHTTTSEINESKAQDSQSNTTVISNESTTTVSLETQTSSQPPVIEGTTINQDNLETIELNVVHIPLGARIFGIIKRWIG